jgi:TolB-like protein
MRLALSYTWLFACALAGTAAASETAIAPTKAPSIAVMSLVGQGVDSTSALIVTDALSDELMKSGKFRVMERTQMEKILAEQGFQQSGGCDGTECAIEVGKLLSVDHMVVGCLGKLGESYTLNARVVDITTGEVVGSARQMQRGAIDQMVANALPVLTNELAQAMDRKAGRPAPAEKKSTWGYWVAGGVVVTGGIAAALLLTQGSDEATPAVVPPNDDKAWQMEVTWP